MKANVLHRLLLLAILVGLGFSVFAAFEVLDTALTSACSVNPFLSCGAVASSGDTGFPPPRGPIPDYAVGLLGFIALLALDIPLLRTYRGIWLKGVIILATLGLVVSAALAYVELAIIQHLCPVCLGAYLSDAGVLVIAVLLLRLRSREEDDTDTTVDKDGSSDHGERSGIRLNPKADHENEGVRA